MAHETSNVVTNIPPGLPYVQRTADHGKGGDRERSCAMPSEPVTAISGPWDFADIGQSLPDEAIEIGLAVSSWADRLTETDVLNLKAVLGHEIARNTIKPTFPISTLQGLP